MARPPDLGGSRSPGFSEEHLKATAKVKEDNDGPCVRGWLVTPALSLHNVPPNTHLCMPEPFKSDCTPHTLTRKHYLPP